MKGNNANTRRTGGRDVPAGAVRRGPRRRLDAGGHLAESQPGLRQHLPERVLRAGGAEGQERAQLP